MFNIRRGKILPDSLLSSGKPLDIKEVEKLYENCENTLKHFFKAGVTPDITDDIAEATLFEGNFLFLPYVNLTFLLQKLRKHETLTKHEALTKSKS